MNERIKLDLTFDELFSEFLITLDSGVYELDSLLNIFFNHPDTWVDHGDNVVYVYNDTLAPSAQVGSIESFYNVDGSLGKVVINREYM